MAVMLAVPVALFGAFVAIAIAGLGVDIYSQIGLVMLVGLSSKAAILMVEFAEVRRKSGLAIREAAATAARLRFRAVLMTTLSFVFGVVPLVVASGAGAAGRRSLGTAVFGGMLAATILGTLLIPALYTIAAELRARAQSR